MQPLHQVSTIVRQQTRLSYTGLTLCAFEKHVEISCCSGVAMHGRSGQAAIDCPQKAACNQLRNAVLPIEVPTGASIESKPGACVRATNEHS